MAQVYRSGTVHLWIKFPPTLQRGLPANRILMLGEGMVGPESQIVPTWTPVYADTHGSTMPSEIISGLEHAYTMVTLTRYSEKCLQFLQKRPYVNPVPAVSPSTVLASDAHPLMIAEGLFFTLYLLYTARNVAAMNKLPNGKMPAGFRFPTTILEGPDVRKPGTRPNKVSLLFHSYPRMMVLGGVPSKQDALPIPKNFLSPSSVISSFLTGIGNAINTATNAAASAKTGWVLYDSDLADVMNLPME